MLLEYLAVEPICTILGFIVGIVVLAAVGHALWLLFNAFFRIVFGSQDGSNNIKQQSSSTPGEFESRVASDLEAAKRLVNYAQYKGWLSAEQLTTLRELIQNCANRVFGGPIENEHEPVEHSHAWYQSQVTGPVPVLLNPCPDSQKAAISTTNVQPDMIVPVHPLDEPEPVSPPLVVQSGASQILTLGHNRSNPSSAPPISLPRKALTASLMRAFMEKSNIRWIELISASLIVVCSVGLVISLWNTLSTTNRYFPSLVFLIATAAVHAAGQYTLRMWNLRNTSRGILHIGLMLIPLAVLVGILLSDRQGQRPGLDWMTIVVIAIGTAVYGGAAVTACRALFASRYLPVAITVIAGAMTLVPIQYMGAEKRLSHPAAATILIPLLGIGLANVLMLSRSSRRLALISSGRSLRMAAQVWQLLFASTVPAYFWLMKAGSYSAINDLALLAAGLWLAGWASWGWTTSRIGFTSIPRPSDARIEAPVPSSAGTSSATETLKSVVHQAAMQKRSKGSWLNVFALGLACICSLALAAIMWQMSASRLLFASFLSVLCVWWLCHGWRCQFLVSQVAGTVAGTLAIGLFIEWLFPNAPIELKTAHWFSFSRIVSLNASCLCCGLIGAGILSLTKNITGESCIRPSARTMKAVSGKQYAISLLSGGGLVLLGTTGLTTLSSLVPWSSPAYGGNWAPIMLLLDGAILMIAGTAGIVCLQARTANEIDRPSSTRWLSYLFPIAQGFILLGAIRLCQSAPLVPEWLADLRPYRSWAVGTAVVALVWSGIAAVLRTLDGRRAGANRSDSTILFAVHSLSFGAVVVSVVSGIFLSRLSDQLAVLSSLGWLLPVTFGLLFLAVREAAYREFAVILVAGWVATVMISLGWKQEWWETLGLSGTVSILALGVLAILLVSRYLLREAEDDENWLFRGSRWSTVLLLRTSWTAWLAGLFVPVSIQFWNSLAPIDSATASTHFLWMPLDFTRSSAAFLSAVALAGITVWSKNSQSDTTRLWLASLPIVLAALIGCVTPAPYSVPAFLVGLSATLVALELLSLTRTKWGQRLYATNQLISKGKWPESPTSWLALTVALGIAFLVLGTTSVGLSQLIGRIPEPLSAQMANTSTLSGWLANLVKVSIWSGPLIVLLMVRWFSGMWTSAPARAITGRGFALGICLTCVCTLAGAVNAEQALLFGLPSFTLIMVVLAWKTLSFATTWNYLGLRRLDTKSTPRQLLSKSCGGARWRQAEQAAWNIWKGGIVTATLLSMTAAVLVALYPTRIFSELDQVGSLWSLLSVVLAVALWWLLGLQRGMSKFGLLALTLGLMGPMVAASYASWLLQNPTAKIASVADFEPYRLLVGMWLISLVCGVVIRILSGQSGRRTSTWAELSWVGLAILVGLLVLIGLPVDSRWASAQLMVLATTVAVSSEASGKIWRGWVAALLGILAWTPWMFDGGKSDWLFYPWQALWGCTAVSLVCLASRLILQKFGLNTVNSQTQPNQPGWTVDRAACVLVSCLSIVLSGLWIVFQSNLVSTPNSASWVVAGLSLANLVLAAARLWDSGPSQRGLSVYLAIVAVSVVLVNLGSSWFVLPRIQAELAWLGGLLGAMTLMATLLREMSLQRLPLQRAFHFNKLVTDVKLRQARDAMAMWHTLAALVCLIPSVWLVLTIPNAGSRLAAIALPMLGAVAILPVSIEARRSFQRGSVILLASATLILAWWADLPSAWSVRQENQSWLFVHRAFLACVVLAIVYPLVALRRSFGFSVSPVAASGSMQPSTIDPTADNASDAWTPALIIGGWICLSLAALIGLGMILGTLLGHWSDFPATVGLGIKCSTLVGWMLIFSRLIQAAARPMNVDRLTDTFSRTVMVYVAEIAMVLGCLAAYQHFPHLFSGVFLPWWPLVVFGIAFISAGIGQILQRASQPIIADPIHQSSLLLPLIPLAGVWWENQGSPASHWSEWGSYWLLLAAASSLYGLYGWTRGSVWLRTVSAGAALLSFWALLLSRPDLQFFDRPQVWLLPPALGALFFVEWNRSKLDSTVVTVSRYICILVAYMSSTAEVFLKAIEGNLWQPLLLLFLALCGAIVGMVLRIRAFLYCGATFIMVALFGMVWHAAQAIDQVWPWWVFGIATGISLLTLLGYFEKNRSKILKYLEELKTWQQ